MPNTPITLGRAALRRLRPAEVLQQAWPGGCLRSRWFRLLDEEQPVVVGPCGHFFEADEYEMVRVCAVRMGGWRVIVSLDADLALHAPNMRTAMQALLEHGCAPFSRAPVELGDPHSQAAAGSSSSMPCSSRLGSKQQSDSMPRQPSAQPQQQLMPPSPQQHVLEPCVLMQQLQQAPAWPSLSQSVQ